MWQVKKRWWEDKGWGVLGRGGGVVPPQRETFGEEEDKLRERRGRGEEGEPGHE